MDAITANEIRTFLKKLGERYPHSGTLYLIGGGALCLLGNPRPTVDLEYAADFSSSDAQLRDAMHSVANEMDLDLEDMMFTEFIPLPNGADKRHRSTKTARLRFEPAARLGAFQSRVLRSDGLHGRGMAHSRTGHSRTAPVSTG